MGSIRDSFKKRDPRIDMYKGESGLMKTLHALSTPLYITAGMIDESIKRGEGKKPTPYADILKESSANLLPWISDNRRRITYGDVIGADTPAEKIIAFGMDIFGDPVTYIPAAATTKLAKGAGAILKHAVRKPAKGLIRGADKLMGTNFTQGGEKLVDAVRRAVKPHSDLERLGGKALVHRKMKSFRDLDNSARNLQEQIEKELTDLMPTYAERERVFDLVEHRPLIAEGGKLSADDATKMMADPDNVKWQAKIADLTPKEYHAFRRTVRIQKQIEKWKQEAGLITDEHMANFNKKFGLQHLTHMKNTKENAIAQAEEMLKAIKEGDQTALDWARRYKAADGSIGDTGKVVKEIEKRIKETIDYDSLVSPEWREQARKMMISAHPRKIAKDAKEQMGLVNMDVARVLGVDAAQVGRAQAALHHSKILSRWAGKKGYIWNDIPTADALAEKFGKEGAEKLARGGFKRLKTRGLGDASGKYVPKALANEIEGVYKAYRSPAVMKDFLQSYKKVQDIWKAWTLALFPTYHARNHISNIWNNFLAGMGPTSHQHYEQAFRHLYQFTTGTMDEASEKIIREATKYRVIGGGQFEGEIGEVVRQKFSTLKPLGKAAFATVHPAHNKAIQWAFKKGKFLEDHARLAHYMWARNSKGMGIEEAVSSVNKYLFDYKYGITPFEKKMFRDFAAPFYTWTRFNLPLQLEMLALKPGRMLVLPKGMRAFEDVGEWFNENADLGGPGPNEMYMADWMKRATKVRLRYNEKNEAYEYFMLDNWIPSADLNKLFDKEAFRDMVTGLLSPGIKLPIEILFNYNLFQKKKIKEFKGQRKKFFGLDFEPNLEHTARTIRIFNEANKMMDAFIFQTGKTGKAEAITRFAIGKVYPYKPEQQKDWWVSNSNKTIGWFRYLRNYAERQGHMQQVDVLDGTIEELTAERDYFQDLKIEKPGKKRKRARRDIQWP